MAKEVKLEGPDRQKVVQEGTEDEQNEQHEGALLKSVTLFANKVTTLN